MMTNSGAWSFIFAGAVGTAAIGGLLYYLTSPSSLEPVHGSGVYVLIVRLKLASNRTDDFMRLWQPYVQWVHKNEPGTLTYKGIVSETERDVVILYERYATKSDLEDVHQKSAPFLEFGKKLMSSELVVEKVASSFYEHALGYSAKPGSSIIGSWFG